MKRCHKKYVAFRMSLPRRLFEESLGRVEAKTTSAVSDAAEATSEINSVRHRWKVVPAVFFRFFASKHHPKHITGHPCVRSCIRAKLMAVVTKALYTLVFL